MKAILYDINNREKKNIEISESLFSNKVNNYSIWLAIKVEEANKRIGCANTKTKAEVAGSGKKPWRQKGTGRARVGTRRNPIWVGGGIVFGPKPRSYKLKINKKVKRLAYLSLFSLKYKLGNIKFIEDIHLNEIKTKNMVQIFKNLNLNSSVLLIYGDKVEKENCFGEKVLTISDNDKKIKESCKNIDFVKTLHWNNLAAKDIFYSKNILITESALINLQEKYTSKVNV
ncbi:MAG: 50S ribosomal protein L4 [Spirochaetes bacterium]|nr:50S ribosomal protein L4 [Spirochaetota bacterium]